MSWTEVFPVLTDEMVEIFRAREHHSAEGASDWFSVEKIINPGRDHSLLVSTSLFWKRDLLEQGVLPEITLDVIKNASNLGLAGRFPPWESYVLPIMRAAKSLRVRRPDVLIRVYLAHDLGFLVEELASVGCEVYLMKCSSIRHNPGAMWRFLALENSSCPVVVSDSDRMESIEYDISRTEAACKSGLGGWRVPYNCTDSEDGGYRPMSAAQFGSSHSYPMRELMEAFVWCNLVGEIPNYYSLDGYRDGEIVGTSWPDYGFDEWFLLAAMYPRMAMNGLLTFFPWDKVSPGQFFVLDIEYATWANSSSELINYPNPDDVLGDMILPWANWKDEYTLRVRLGTTVVRRIRQKIGPARDILNHVQCEGIKEFPLHQGDLSSLLEWAKTEVVEPWWIDLNPQVRLQANGAELFLDRRYEAVDVVHCGYFFIRITMGIAGWAQRQDLDPGKWGEGKLLKVPKLGGPMTLWNADFSRRFQEELKENILAVSAETLLRAWIDQGRARVMETTAKNMGWKVR